MLDDARAVVLEGSGTTDMFGAIEFDLGEISPRAVAIEVSAPGATATVPIR